MQQNAGQAQAMPETEAVPAGKRPGARNERLNVRDAPRPTAATAPR